MKMRVIFLVNVSKGGTPSWEQAACDDVSEYGGDWLAAELRD